MPWIYDERCDEHGLDPARIASIARRLSRAAEDAHALGLVVFGGSGTGTLRKVGGDSTTVIADLDGPFDGGDGGDSANVLRNRMP